MLDCLPSNEVQGMKGFLVRLANTCAVLLELTRSKPETTRPFQCPPNLYFKHTSTFSSLGLTLLVAGVRRAWIQSFRTAGEEFPGSLF